MRLLFCSDPLNPRIADSAFEREVAAADRLGIPYSLVSFERLVNEEDTAGAVRGVPAATESEVGIYRGWMLQPKQYGALYNALLQRGTTLINSPEAYQHCHYLPESYAIIEPFTARSIWVKTGTDFPMDTLMELLQPFGAGPVLLKDFVKSRKHEWEEACFIASASDRAAVDRVVRRFLELQGPELSEGLVFREFVRLEALQDHSRSGMPLAKEFRLFFLDGEAVVTTPYWEEGDYAALTPPAGLFSDVARRVKSRFFTMDVARRHDGEWMIIELGDGQVAGLPEAAEPEHLYRALSGVR